MLLGEGARGHSPLPPPLKPLPQPQLGLLALPKGQKKGFPPTYTAKEEFFNNLLEGGPWPAMRSFFSHQDPVSTCLQGDGYYPSHARQRVVRNTPEPLPHGRGSETMTLLGMLRRRSRCRQKIRSSSGGAGFPACVRDRQKACSGQLTLTVQIPVLVPPGPNRPLTTSRKVASSSGRMVRTSNSSF